MKNLIDRIGRELLFMGVLWRSYWALRPIEKREPISVGQDLERVCDRAPAAPAILFEDQTWTYRDLDSRANAFAHWGLSQNLAKGDTVAVFLQNRPDYLACWMGLSKIGVACALINSNLIAGPLTHSLQISRARHIVTADGLAAAAAAARAGVDRPMTIWSLDAEAEADHDLEHELARAPRERPDRARLASVSLEDVALLIYTSGTTGQPKAANILHRRAMSLMRIFAAVGDSGPRDRVYVPLPLYHATGGLCGVGFCLTTGGSVILRRKFSATHFWDDIADNGATAFFYIGELCRYLLNQPNHPKETAHRLRIAIGNGLRPEVWERFQPRFKVPRIVEFYGSTEGNVSIANVDGRMGAVGRVPRYLDKIYNARVIRYDVETDSIPRAANGLCIEAGPNEVGEAIGEIRGNARYKFEGYSGDKAQTEKKILRDVFAAGDAWFRTGDLMRRDEDGYFFFVDRIGDTFRWKGENVSTTEVAGVLSEFAGVTEATVYGVRVGNLDGRAGMAAVRLAPDTDLCALRAHVDSRLPHFARPLFLRVRGEIETTGTFKYRKQDLVKDGFDPRGDEQILFAHPNRDCYVPLTPEDHQRILDGAIRV